MQRIKSNEKLMLFMKKLLSVLVLFAGCLCLAPFAGVFRTIPFLFAAAVVCSLAGTSHKLCCMFSFVVCLVLNLSADMGVLYSIVYSLAGAIFVFFGTVAFKCVCLARRTKKKQVKTKCIYLTLLLVAACAALSLILCGNTVSFLIHDGQNTKYIEKNYDKNVKKEYTIYDAQTGEYRTIVTFEEIDKLGEKLIHNGMYIGQKDGKKFDLVKNYYTDRFLDNAKIYVGNALMGDKEGFAVINNSVVLKDNEFAVSNDDYNKYLPKVKYVALFDGIIKSGEKAKFLSKCQNAVDGLKEKGCVYDEILLCAGDGNVVYCAMVNMDTTQENIADAVCEFDEGMLSGFNTEKQDILDYWLDK